MKLYTHYTVHAAQFGPELIFQSSIQLCVYVEM